VTPPSSGALALEALRRLLLVTAAVCLLGTGGVDLVRPSAGAAPGAVLAGGAGAESVPPATVSALRSALAAATPQLSGDDGPVGGGPAAALAADAPYDVPGQVRPAAGRPVPGPGLRGPPLTTGT
jgi:hypothetical protein